MIGVDWGTTSLRAFRIENGNIVGRRDMKRGITQIPRGGFATALRDAIGDWLVEGESKVLMSGMIGSRQGWIEAPYALCPAGADELAASLTRAPFDDLEVAIVPGLRHFDATGVPEVMRGEETQLLGALTTIGADALACLPGTHSKWADLAGGIITGFTTHLTGEVYAALRGHTILSRMMQDAPTDEAAFLRGVMRAGETGGLLHHLFGVRTLGLFGDLSEPVAASYLSGLLIGHEIAAAAPTSRVHLIGAAPLCRLYALALEQKGVEPVIGSPDVAAAGLALIAERAGWN